MERDEQGHLVFQNVTEWRRYTAYANTKISVAKSQADIQNLLLQKFGAERVMVDERQGGQIAVHFILKGRPYSIPLRRAKLRKETMAQTAQLRRQAMRVLHWYLKNMLMMRFLTSAEEMLMPYMMLDTPDGPTRASDMVLSGSFRLALPAPKGDDINGEFKEV